MTFHLRPLASTLALAFIAAAFAPAGQAAPDRQKLADQLATAEYVLEKVMADPESAIPSSILQEAKGIILTFNYRGGFLFVGGRGGHGVMVAKKPATGEWGPPAFVRAGGVDLGLMLGLKEVNTLYVIMDNDTLRRAATGRFDIGGDVSAVAGPAEASREATRGRDYREANLLVYTDAQGLYAGVSVKGGWIAPRNRHTRQFYDTDYNIPEILLSDWFDIPREAGSLLKRLNYYMRGGR